MRNNNIRTITMYLPQFHAVAENNEWWGEGYTEWTAVRRALPLFDGHNQPRTPLKNNYYDLLDKKTMMWQSELMKKYGIFGQCFYHYYFKDGRTILEKPAENLLKWKDIEMPFCFCWDHNNWTRTWSAIGGNSWADQFETKGNASADGILLEQKFGNHRQWEKHFMYLLPFFNDDRYIKKDGMPVFLIHGPGSVYCLSQMIHYWKRLAVENGFSGLYVIGENAESDEGCMDAVLLRAPHMFWKLKNRGNHYGFDYDEMWSQILNAPPKFNCKTYFEGMADCDDTPRRARNGVVAENFSIDKFQKYMSRLYKKSQMLGNEFLFINAWNEWGEGMYLEPDEEHGYACLEAIRDAQALSDDMEWKYDVPQSYLAEEYDRLKKKSMKNCQMWRCMDKWMYLLEENVSLSEYLLGEQIETVAVYGMGFLGRHLLRDLNKSQIKVRYVIDKYKKNVLGYEWVNPDDELPSVDAIIITIVNEYDEICARLKDKTDAKLINLEELVYEL